MLLSQRTISKLCQRERDWFTRTDLKDICFHEPVAPRHRQCLCFSSEYLWLVTSISRTLEKSTHCVRTVYTQCLERGGNTTCFSINILTHPWLIPSNKHTGASPPLELPWRLQLLQQLGLHQSSRKWERMLFNNAYDITKVWSWMISGDCHSGSRSKIRMRHKVGHRTPY